MSNPTSLADLATRIEDIYSYFTEHTFIILIGTKCDIEPDPYDDAAKHFQRTTPQDIAEFKAKYQHYIIAYYETSAKTKYNIQEAFEACPKFIKKCYEFWRGKNVPLPLLAPEAAAQSNMKIPQVPQNNNLINKCTVQ